MGAFSLIALHEGRPIVMFDKSSSEMGFGLCQET